LNEIKKKARTPTSKHVQQQKNTKTLINNPHIVPHSFIPQNSNRHRQNENFSCNTNTNKNFLSNDINYFHKSNNNHLTEEEENLPSEENMDMEQINKLRVNLVKTNNLNVLNNRQHNVFYSSISINDGNNSNNINSKEEFYINEIGMNEFSKKSLTPKLINKNINLISTKESNDSSDSSNNNKFPTQDENINYNQYSMPIFHRNYLTQPMMAITKGKRLDFNKYSISNMNPCSQFNYMNPNFNTGYMPNITTSNMDNNYPYFNQNSNNYQTGLMMNNYNMANLPENAFSYNSDVTTNPSIMKSNSEKKKIKKSKDEVDQTLFIINLDNTIYGRDKRTTVMIKNIPNKYTTQSLLEEIDLNFKGKYDFFYLPMDFEVINKNF
jgi:hypothetical protein